MSEMSIGEYFTAIFSNVWKNIGDIMFHVSWTNPYFVLLLVYIVAFLLESFLPAKKPYSVLGRKGFWTDLGYLLFIDFLFGIIGFIALTYTVEFAFTKGMQAMGVSLPLMNPIHLPFWAQAIIFFVVMDFCQFFAHYLLHHINFFWKFHKIHHAQETLGFASTRHFHIMEYFVLKPMGWIPAGLLGFSGEEYILLYGIYMWVAYSLVFFSHCNVNVNFGFLNKIIITPNNHYWHHAKNIPRKYGVNYASVLMIWDHLFRSYYLPTDPKLIPQLGVPDNDVPETFWGQLIYPFKTLFKKEEEQQVASTKSKK